jgi:hypothetical protein
VAGAAAALAAPASAAASVQQVLLPGPTPYPTQSPPLVAGSTSPTAPLPFAIHARADQRVLAGVDGDGRLVSLRVLHRLVLTGKGDYLIAIGAPVEDVRAGAGSESEPGLRAGQILWSGFSPGRKVLAAELQLRPRAALRFLPVRLHTAREGSRYSLTVTNATTVDEVAYEGNGFPRELARLLDRTRRESLAGERLRTAYASVDGLVGTRKNAARIVGPLRVEGVLRFPSTPTSVRGATVRGKTVVFSAVLGDASPLSLHVDVHGGGGAPRRLLVVARPTRLVRALAPPRAPSWVAAVRRRATPGRVLLRRLIDARMQLVRSDQYQAFLSNPDAQGTSSTVYVYETVAPPKAAPTSRQGSDGGNGLVLALALVGSVLGVGAALVLWAHS